MAAKKKAPHEEWRPVPGFVGLYEVSSEGRVRSLPRTTAAGTLGGRLLAPSAERNGYLRVTFSVAGKPHRNLLHRLVLLAFAGECPAGHECRHLDGDKKNCRLGNLAWGTRSQNALDRIAHGTQVVTRGERHGMTRLSDADAQSILRLRRAGTPVAEVAKRFSVGQATVSRIANGKGWKHIAVEAV